MTRTVTDVVANLILPPAGPLLVAIAGLILARRHRRLGLALGACGIAALWTLSLPLVGTRLLRPLEPPPVERSDLAGAEVIVVLGGGVIEHSAEYSSMARILASRSFGSSPMASSIMPSVR